ncbi:glycosyltransferase family protein [Horticoccus sp. 23ND18S-11]|uniref:glycosyltransferase family protein n=1 Tax=Horticoccus sp. 23ND18S-11 TaxID=3391832 RepID=UPI0039C9FA19
MRILFSTCSPASYMAPPRLALEQINCGPDWLDADIGGYVTTLNTPSGAFDLAAVAARLPADQQPDAVVCLVDASWRSIPRNLKAFRCPKVLLVADTHHLNMPITGMIQYARQEAFDRIVFLYDRHHAEFFQIAGLKQLYWFPGLTFPHDDRAVAAARSTAAPESRIAFVGQTGICHPRRIQMLSQLHGHQLPLSVKSVSQREGLSFYGSSLIGFNSSLNGDLNLRVFEILASGAMLLTDELAPASGLTDVWQPGRDLVTYGTPAELLERARHAINHSAETRAIGAAGARWFDQHFSEEARRTAFAQLVLEGRGPALFPLPEPKVVSAPAVLPAVEHRLTLGYEYVQELHRNLDRVIIALDETVPEQFARMCATLPRVELRRGLPAAGTRVSFLAVGRKNFNSPALAAAVNVWSWEDAESERVNLVRRCSSMGLALVNPAMLVFSRQAANTHKNEGAVALVRLEQGGYDDALLMAQRELEKNPRSVEALLVMLELALEKGSQTVAESALSKLRTIAPHHPRLRQLSSQPGGSNRNKRPQRLLRVARSLLEQQKWGDAGTVAQEAATYDAQSAEAQFILGSVAVHGSEWERAIALLGRATFLAPDRVEYWRELAQALRGHGRTADALSALLHVAAMDADSVEAHLRLAEGALEAGHGAIAIEALETAGGLQPGHPLVARWMPRATQLVAECNYGEPRDLLLSHVEVTRLQGTGVLIERFFPDARSFVTVRSRTLYKGEVNFGGVHFSLDLPGLTECGRTAILKRLLGAYTFRRILSVPFFASDFMHAVAAHTITGAPLCCYVMDDQVLHSREVPAELAQRVFAAADVRLAISPEMIAEYSAWFRCSFGLLPPVVTTRANEVPNDWTPVRGTVRHCVMVGNIWSAKQFDQLRTFSRAAGLKIDWFGNAKVAWLPQDRQALEADGIFCQGFLPEDRLAQRLANYPFVLLPSGTLDGTEDNEWLTRLSLPSRMVFILTKTLTPMLVLGSAKTAAARFVNQFGLGVSSNYDASEAQAKIEEITAPTQRTRLLANARRVAPCFLMPACGEWIWQSLAAKRALPTPFDTLYLDSGDATTAANETTPASGSTDADAGTAVALVESTGGVAFDQNLQALVGQLSDHALHDSFLAADEPRQRLDVRGVVRFLHDALCPLGPVTVRLLAIERLSRLVKNHRGTLVVWAELLEEAGDKAEAAAKARQALSLYYDDVYTQTLFVRCVGDENFHADAKDRFCPHPFENFEIYKDGSVFPCNCTQVPFPIGNAHTQTAEEIWQSPQAKAVRASILDGSFRFCSPMTCWQRFNLPKKSEQPERWAQLQAIGVDGVQPPKHLNLSYDLSCNLSCPSCRNAQIMATHEERQKLERVRDRIVLPLLENKTAETVYITGSGDAFGSPHFRSVLKQLCDPKFAHVDITLGTNGQLITPRLWEEFQPLHARFRDITISIDGATPDTYEKLRRGSTWEKLLRTMGILEQARRTGVIRRIMVNMVVQQENFLDMRRMVELCKGWAVDGIRFYRIRQWGNVVPGAFMTSDIANPLHPRHPELMALLADPVFTDPIVDHYDMYALILQAQSALRETAVAAEPVLTP